MKQPIKYFLQSLFVIAFSACKEEEENYSIEPAIKFVKVEFGEGSTPGTIRVDTIKIVFSFTDGDMDFGFDHNNLEFHSYPYNESFFFQENKGSIEMLNTTAQTSSSSSGMQYYDILNIPDPYKGKLVFPRTRKKEGYGDLPVYNCVDYEYLHDRKLLIKSTDAAVLDYNVRITDTLRSSTAVYYQILDTLLVKSNPDHYNIEVDYLIDNGQGFEEFDWHKEFCSSTFDGVINGACTHCGPFKIRMFNKKRGEITYNMASIGFRVLFGNKKMKLRIQIKDRALHRSNTIETPEFFLDDI